MSTDPSGRITEQEWDESSLFRSVNNKGRRHLQTLRGMYFEAKTIGRDADAADILDAARSHASQFSTGGHHPDHDKFLKQDEAVRGLQKSTLGQAVIGTSNRVDVVSKGLHDGRDAASKGLHEGWEFAVDVKMILSGDAEVELDQLEEIAPGVFIRPRIISPRETSYDKRLEASMILSAEFDAALILLPLAKGSKIGYGLLDDAERMAFQRVAPVMRPAATTFDTIPAGQRLTKFDGEYAARQILGHEPVTRAGRQINYHAAERMVDPPRGRIPMTAAEVDHIIDTADRIKKVSQHPLGDTITLQKTTLPGKPEVVLDAETGNRIITVINPKR